MTTTVLGIYNGALSAVKARGRLSSLSDRSREREECDIWYDLIRDQVQEAAYWPGCRTTARLALLATRDASVSWTAGDPEDEFAYAYALPDNYLRAWHLTTYERFSISFDPTRTRSVLNTSAATPMLVYATRQENPVFWSPGQRRATIHALAAAIAGAITGQDRLTTLQYQLADEIIRAARADAQMAHSMQDESLPPALAARGYANEFTERYYYPYGPLFTATNG